MKFIPPRTRHCQIGPFRAPICESQPHIQLNEREIATLERALKVLEDLSCMSKEHSLLDLAFESTGAESRIENIITDTKS